MRTRAVKIAALIILVAGLLITAVPVNAADGTIPDWLLTPVPGLDGSVISMECIGDGEVLCVTYTPEPYRAGFEIRNLFLDETEALDFAWDPAEHGWPGYYLGVPCLAKASPDGSLIVVLYQLATVQPGTEALDCQGQPLVLLAWRQADNHVEAAGVLHGAGLPRVMFTADSRYLIADSVLDCNPDLASYETCRHQPVVRFDAEPGWWRKPLGRLLLYYDTVTGAGEVRRSVVNPLSVIGKCPYSDYYLLGMTWCHNYDESFGYLRFGELGSQEITGLFRFDTTDYTWVGWVGPESALLKRDSDCVLVHPDGTSSPAPSADWEIYWWFMDDSCLFSLDGGETIRYGLVDWDDFDLDVSIELPLPAHFLDDYIIEDYVPQVGLILRGRDNSEHPGRYMRMSVGPGRVPDHIWRDR